MTRAATPADDKRRTPPVQRLGRYGLNLLRAPLVMIAMRRRLGAGVRFGTIHRVIVIPELGLAYNRVKKNANTTLTMLLRELAGGAVTHRDTAKWESQTPYDLPLRQLAQLQRLRFMVVVRNPYSRVLSAFLDKFREAKYRSGHGDFPLTPDGFARFVTYLEQGGLARDGHWNLQSRLIVAPLAQFDAVLHFETLGADLETALQTVGLDFDATRLRAAYPSDEGKQTGASSRMDAYYTHDLAARVARLFADDFTALGYDTAYPGTLPGA